MDAGISRTTPTEMTQSDITMSAAESLISELFEEADNDSDFHRCAAEVRSELAHGKCLHTPEEIAERILAWSGAL